MTKMKPICDWSAVPLMFDIPIACAITGRSYENIKYLCGKGQIPAFKVGNEWRFDKDLFREWMQKQSLENMKGSEGKWNGSQAR